MKAYRVHDLGKRRVLHEREGELAHARVRLKAEPVEAKRSEAHRLVVLYLLDAGGGHGRLERVEQRRLVLGQGAQLLHHVVEVVRVRAA